MKRWLVRGWWAAIAVPKSRPSLPRQRPHETVSTLIHSSDGTSQDLNTFSLHSGVITATHLGQLIGAGTINHVLSPEVRRA